MLAAGGSAVDAILATAITLTLVEPVSNGIGSDAYAIVWDGKKLHGLNASGRSPAAWTPDYFAGQKAMPQRGWNSVSVPGCVSAWVEMHKRFGKLPFEKLFERAIEYGRKGFLVSPTIAGQWAKQVPELKSQPGFAEAFLPDGRPPGRASASSFRSTPTCWRRSPPRKAKRSTAASSPRRSKRTRRSTAARCAPPTWPRTSPTGSSRSTMDYRGYTLHEIPPNGQGIVALMALGMLEHFDLRSHPVDGADSVHLQIEAQKLAFADAWRYVADIDYMKAVQARHAAGQGLPEGTSEADRSEARAGLRRRHAAAGRHGLPRRRRRLRHDGVVHPVELHGLRLGRGGRTASRCRTAAPPSCCSRATRTASARASAPTRPSSRASSPATASR